MSLTNKGKQWITWAQMQTLENIAEQLKSFHIHQRDESLHVDKRWRVIPLRSRWSRLLGDTLQNFSLLPWRHLSILQRPTDHTKSYNNTSSLADRTTLSLEQHNFFTPLNYLLSIAAYRYRVAPGFTKLLHESSVRSTAKACGKRDILLAGLSAESDAPLWFLEFSQSYVGIRLSWRYLLRRG